MAQIALWYKKKQVRPGSIFCTRMIIWTPTIGVNKLQAEHTGNLSCCGIVDVDEKYCEPIYRMAWNICCDNTTNMILRRALLTYRYLYCSRIP